VLLGEPGIGKTTVLAGEAARDGVPMFTVREIMTGTETGPGAPLYLDALDEYPAFDIASKLASGKLGLLASTALSASKQIKAVELGIALFGPPRVTGPSILCPRAGYREQRGLEGSPHPTRSL
jgi:hypothetical protein